MKNPEIKLISAFLLSVFSLNPSEATKLSAAPLPHRSDSTKAQEIAPDITPYPRRALPSNNQAKDKDSESENESNKQKQINRQAALEKAKTEKERKLSALAANNKGVQFGQAGKFEEAIAEHEKAVQLEPENKQYRINLSAAYCAFGQKELASHNFADAARRFRQSIAIAPDNAMAGRLLIESLKKAGINPNSADNRITIGDQLITQGDIAGAGIEYQAAEELEQSAHTYVKMGDYVYRLGQVDMAANWYQQALTKDQDCSLAYRQLGFILLSKGDQTQAASFLRKAVILDSKDKTSALALVDLWRKQVATNPQIAENHLGLASALQLSGDLPAAELEYKKVMSLDPRNAALPAAQQSLANAYQHQEAQRHKDAADTLWNQGLKQEALSEISQAVRIEPRNTKYQFFLAECLESSGDLQGAHQAYLTCVLIDPENNQEAAARIKALQSGGKIENAAQAPVNNTNKQIDAPINEANNVSNNTNAKDAKALADQIQSLEMSHNYDQAIDALKELVSNNLENPEMHHHLAVDLMSNGEMGEAISEFRIASALAPGQKTYAADLAQALAINKQSLFKNGQSSNVDSSNTKNDAAGIKQ